MSPEGLHLSGAVLGNLRASVLSCSHTTQQHTHMHHTHNMGTAAGHTAGTHSTHILTMHTVCSHTQTPDMPVTQTPRRTAHAQHTHAIRAHRPQPHVYHMPPTPTLASLACSVHCITRDLCEHIPAHTLHTLNAYTRVVTSTCNN